MGSSSQAVILPGAYAENYTVSGAIGFGCAVGYPDSTGKVAVVTSGPYMGVLANGSGCSDGEIGVVVLSGPCDVTVASTLTWATTPFVKPTTAGKFEPAAANNTAIARCIPSANQGATAAANDIVRVVLGVGAFHA